MGYGGLTELVEHLVALVKNELTDAAEFELLVADEGVETAGSGDDDMWVVLAVEKLDVLLDGSTTIEDTSLDIRHILSETLVLGADLVSQLASVAHDKDGGLALDWLDLLQAGQDEDGCLTKTRLGLADNIGSENGLRNANALNCNGRRCQIWSQSFS